MKKRITLTSKILLGLFLGFIFGLTLKSLPESYIKDTVIIGGIFKVLGGGFTSAIKMMVVPLVFVSLVCGSSSMGDVKQLGRIGTKTMAFYLSTTAIAIITALFLGSVLKPGVGLDMSSVVSGDVAIGESKSIIDIILGIIPSNPIASFANGDMLQIIFFALLTGVAMSMVGEKAEPVRKLFESAYRALKHNGTLVYSTCTLNKEENEYILDWALNNFNLKLENINIDIKEAVPAFNSNLDSSISKAIRILPCKSMEGFFIAKFKKM